MNAESSEAGLANHVIPVHDDINPNYKPVSISQTIAKDIKLAFYQRCKVWAGKRVEIVRGNLGHTISSV